MSVVWVLSSRKVVAGTDLSDLRGKILRLHVDFNSGSRCGEALHGEWGAGRALDRNVTFAYLANFACLRHDVYTLFFHCFGWFPTPTAAITHFRALGQHGVPD